MKFLAYFLLITAVCLNTLSTFAYVEDKDVIRVGLRSEERRVGKECRV